MDDADDAKNVCGQPITTLSHFSQAGFQGRYGTYSLKRQGIKNIVLCPIYFSANGFDKDAEQWLHEHHIFTVDMLSWKVGS